MDIEATFEKFNDDYLKFKDVEVKLSSRPDIHAFILLNQLVPGDSDMISAAEHDEFYLDVSPDELAKVATEEQIRDLVRCGVMCDESGLSMFA